MASSIRHSNADPSSKVRSYTKKYLGNYLGIVVQNNDPEHRGRIKVFVPHVSPSVYKNWIDQKKDLAFKFPGKNINSDLSEIIDDLKQILPWSDCAAPLIGASGSGRYNAYHDKATISDSNKFDTTQTSAVQTKYALNADGIGEKPARKYEVTELKIKDAFTDAAAASCNRVNKHGENYLPSSYSNCAKGSFAIPNVGSHVWVFFREGNPMYPIYFATSFGNTDWQSIYDLQGNQDAVDYPGGFENKSASDIGSYDPNVETYRNKYVLSQKGGTFEIVNTDNRELLKFTHFSGSFLEMNNDTTVQLATKNDQKLVLADQFLTVRGFRSEYVERDLEQIIRGDVYRKIGNLNRDAFTQWKTLVDKIAEIKQLFEMKRTAYTQQSIYIRKVSSGQQKSPPGTSGHAPCPVCTHPYRGKYWNTSYLLTAVPPNLISSIFLGIDQPTLYLNVLPAHTGTTPSFIRPGANPTNFLGGGRCPCCNGIGKSPSTQGGKFDSQDKDTLLTATIREHISDLAKIEQQLGLGGSEIINITKHKIETIGLVMNDFPSVRIDPIGKANNNEMIIMPQGVVTNQSATPLVELVHVDDLPGGSYNLNVCNKYNVLVGAGGMSLKSYGLTEIGGTVVSIAGEQVNIASENEVNIVGDKRLSLTAENLVLRQKNYKQVLVDSNLGVSQNAIIGGSVHIEGELSVQHITAPAEVQETETTMLEGWITPDEVHAKIRDGDGAPCTAIAPVKVNFIPHSHLFVNAPLNLTQSADGTRKQGANCNKALRMPALPVVNCKKVAKDP